MKDAVSNFLAGKRSANTKIAYGYDLGELMRFLRENYPSIVNWRDFTAGMAKAFLEALERKGGSEATLCRRQSSVRSFLRWLKEQGISCSAIADQMEWKRYIPQRLPATKTLNVEQFLVKNPDAFLDLRDNVIILLCALHLPPRVVKLLRVKQIDLENGLISMEHPKKRTVRIPAGWIRYFKNYENGLASIQAGREDDLFVVNLNNRGKPLTRQWIHGVVRRRCGKDITPRVLQTAK